jgi:hypothetical protein
MISNHDVTSHSHVSDHPLLPLQVPGLTQASIVITPSGRFLPGNTFSLRATAQSVMLGGSLTVQNIANGITCDPVIETGEVTSLTTTCTVPLTAAASSYDLQVTWVTNALKTSTAAALVQVVSGAPNKARPWVGAVTTHAIGYGGECHSCCGDCAHMYSRMAPNFEGTCVGTCQLLNATKSL